MEGGVDTGPIVNLGLSIVLLWMPACFWMYSLLAGMIEAEIGAMEGMFGIGAAIGIALTCTASRSLATFLAGGAALWISAIGAPYARSFLHRRAHLNLDLEQMQKTCERAINSPRNSAVFTELGRMCAKMGLTASACLFLERAISLAPNFSADEKRMLTILRREIEGEPDDHPNHCPNCRTANAPGDIRCRKCQGPILVLLAGGNWLPQSAPGKILRIWIVVLGVLFLAPIIGVSLHSPLAVPIIAILTSGGMFLLWHILRQ